MKSKVCSKNWYKLKDRIKSDLISTYPHVNEHIEDYSKGTFETSEEYGLIMDELDGTKEIANLINDLKREDE